MCFICFVRVSFCHFSLPLSVGGWLRFVTVDFSINDVLNRMSVSTQPSISSSVLRLIPHCLTQYFCTDLT